MTLLQAFIEKYSFRLECVSIDQRPDLPNLTDPADHHFKCRITHDRNHLSTYFTQSIAITQIPTIEKVLACLGDDLSYEDSFEQWCQRNGLNPDSRKAEARYKRTKAQMWFLVKPPWFRSLVTEFLATNTTGISDPDTPAAETTSREV